MQIIASNFDFLDIKECWITFKKTQNHNQTKKKKVPYSQEKVQTDMNHDPAIVPLQ